MRQILLTLFVVLFLFSCEKHDDTSFNDKKISGNGLLESIHLDLSSYYEIVAEDAINLNFIQDSTFQVIIEAESNIIDYIEVYVLNNKLFCHFTKNVQIDATKEIHVTVHHIGLEKITMIGAGNISGTNINNRMHFAFAGAGNINMNVECYDLDLTLDGVGKMVLHGKAENSYVTITGNCDYQANELYVNKCWNTITGVGKAYLQVASELHVDISGVGTIYYYGNPLVVKKITGTGSVIKMD